MGAIICDFQISSLSLCSGVSIIADVAESIAETQPISIKRTSLQRSNCYWHEYTSMYIDKDGGAQCVADNEDDEREILPYPGTKSKSGDMEILRILQISSQSADGTKLKLCQEPFANSAGERIRTPIKGISTLRSVVLG